MKLSPSDRNRIHRLVLSGTSMETVAARYKITVPAVRQIAAGLWVSGTTGESFVRGVSA